MIENEKEMMVLSGDLFQSVDGGSIKSQVTAVLRSLDLARVEGEIKLRVTDVNESVRKLEQAQVVSQDLLDTVVSL